MGVGGDRCYNVVVYGVVSSGETVYSGFPEARLQYRQGPAVLPGSPCCSTPWRWWAGRGRCGRAGAEAARGSLRWHWPSCGPPSLT